MNLEDDDFANKRESPRVALEFPVKFRIMDFKDPNLVSDVISGIALNLSVGGIFLETDESNINGIEIYQTDLEKNKLEIALLLFENFGRVKIIGEAVWFYFAQSGGKTKFRYGIKFLEIADSEAQKITAFLEKNISK